MGGSRRLDGGILLLLLLHAMLRRSAVRAWGVWGGPSAGSSSSRATGIPKVLGSSGSVNSSRSSSWGRSGSTRSRHDRVSNRGSVRGAAGAASSSLSSAEAVEAVPGGVFAQKLVESPEDMEAVGRSFGEYADVGDVILLAGGLGTGKTCFSRGYIREVLGQKDLRVTSPSYLLDNMYEAPEGDLTIHHIDLYRLQNPQDTHILAIPQIFSTCACLIEWPERLEHLTPDHRLEVSLANVGVDARRLSLRAFGPRWEEILQQIAEEHGLSFDTEGGERIER